MTKETKECAQKAATVGAIFGVIAGAIFVWPLILLCLIPTIIFIVPPAIGGAVVFGLFGIIYAVVRGKNNNDTTPKPQEKDLRTPDRTLEKNTNDPTVNFDRKTEEPKPQHDTESNKLL